MIKVPKPEVLQAGVRHAEENLQHWNQGNFLNDLHDENGETIPLDDTPLPCGTTACLAGHILLSQGHAWGDIQKMDIEDEALRALGFQNYSAGLDFANAVFYMIDGNDGHLLAKTPEAMAEFKRNLTELTGVEL